MRRGASFLEKGMELWLLRTAANHHIYPILKHVLLKPVRHGISMQTSFLYVIFFNDSKLSGVKIYDDCFLAIFSLDFVTVPSSLIIVQLACCISCLDSKYLLDFRKYFLCRYRCSRPSHCGQICRNVLLWSRARVFWAAKCRCYTKVASD